MSTSFDYSDTYSWAAMWAFLVMIFLGAAFLDSWLSNRYLAKRIAELEDKPWL